MFGFGLQFLLGYWTILSAGLLFAALIGVYYLEKLLERRTRQLAKASRGLLSGRQVKFMLKFISGVLTVFILSLLLLIWKERFRQEIIWLLISGFGAHLIGDLVTKDGIPLLWPLRQRFALKLFRTGSTMESLVGVILLGLNIYLGYEFWMRFGLGTEGYWRQYLG